MRAASIELASNRSSIDRRLTVHRRALKRFAEACALFGFMMLLCWLEDDNDQLLGDAPSRMSITVLSFIRHDFSAFFIARSSIITRTRDKINRVSCLYIFLPFVYCQRQLLFHTAAQRFAFYFSAQYLLALTECYIFSNLRLA